MRLPTDLHLPLALERPGTRRILLLALLPIGDSLFITPTVQALRARYPGAYIAALARPLNAPILRCVPAVDEVITLPPLAWGAGLPARLAMLFGLRHYHFEVAVDFTSPWYKWIAMLSGIRRRTYLKLDRLWWLLPTSHPRWRTIHAIRHYYECARELDLPPWETVDHAPRIVLPQEAYRAANAFLRRRGLARCRRPLIALHPGGAGLDGRKRWPASRFVELAEALEDRWGARILLLGGPDETALVQTIAACLREPPVVLAGALPMLTSMALVTRCDLFVGNDSSPLHAAAALGTSYVGIYGPTSLANFRAVPPRPRQGRIVAAWPPSASPVYFVGGRPIWQRPRARDAEDALATISVADVLGLAETLLREQRALRSHRHVAGG
jgi:ADP-heptose:LPS heptosyltransferase